MVSGVRCQVSAPPPAKKTAGQIEKETFLMKFHTRCQEVMVLNTQTCEIRNSEF